MSDHSNCEMQTRSNIRALLCLFVLKNHLPSDQLLAQPVYIANEFRSGFDVISAKVCTDQSKQQRLHHVAVSVCVYSRRKPIRAMRWFFALYGFCCFCNVIVFTL